MSKTVSKSAARNEARKVSAALPVVEFASDKRLSHLTEAFDLSLATGVAHD